MDILSVPTVQELVYSFYLLSGIMGYYYCDAGDMLRVRETEGAQAAKGNVKSGIIKKM